MYPESAPHAKGFTIVVAGKGGTGKTLVSALLVKNQVKHGALLAIDADPDANLAEALGVEVTTTVGRIRESLLDYRTRRKDTSGTMTAEKLFEQRIMEAIKEEKGYDLLVMGHGEGHGCYCAVNHILRSIIDSQARNYVTVIIDCEAGLEHISRRTTRDVDVMLVVTDGSAKGVTTAQRVRTLSSKLNVNVGRIVVVANKVAPATKAIIEEKIAEAGLELLGSLPLDPDVAEIDAQGKSIWLLPEDGPLMTAAKSLCAQLDALRGRQIEELLRMESDRGRFAEHEGSR